MGAPRALGDISGLRSWPIPGFDEICIYYVATEDVVRIVRILQGRRDLERIFKNEEFSAD